MFDYITTANDWVLLQSFLQKKNDNRDAIKELALIQKQTSLLKDLTILLAQYQRPKKMQEENLLPMQSLLQVPDPFKNKNQCTLKKKPSNIQNNSFIIQSMLSNFYDEDIDQQQLLKALLQIKEKCSFQTYNLAERIANKSADANLKQFKKTIYRQYAQIKELKQKCLVLNCENQLLRQEVEKLHENLDSIKNEKIEMKKKKSQYFQKEDQFVKLYTKLSIQQKKINDSKKINSMREGLLENIQEIMQKFIEKVDQEDDEGIKQLDLFQFCMKYRDKMNNFIQQIERVRELNSQDKKYGEQTRSVLIR